ncbi:MAG: hypothetical protein ACLFSU_00825 [Acholeplasmataceae bacterium]
MKKIAIILVFFVSLFFLASCQEDEPTDYDVRIVSEDVETDTIDVHAVIDETVSSLDLLKEISLEVAATTYEEHEEAIGFDHVTLTIYLYGSDQAHEDEDPTYGYQVLEINEDDRSPGMSLSEDELTID